LIYEPEIIWVKILKLIYDEMLEAKQLKRVYCVGGCLVNALADYLTWQHA